MAYWVTYLPAKFGQRVVALVRQVKTHYAFALEASGLLESGTTRKTQNIWNYPGLFYEVTFQIPFETSEPLKNLHCHTAINRF